MGDIKITYETLFEILRRERGSEALSELSPTFFADIYEYIKEKERIVAEKIGGEFFGESEVEMAQKQLSNAKRIIESIYGRRERKIIDMALNKTKVGEMPLRGLLEEERQMFEDVVETLLKHRKLLVSSIVKRDKLKSVRNEDVKIIETNKVTLDVANREDKEAENANSVNVSSDAGSNESNMVSTTIKFVKDVETFIGKDLEEYGPYKAGEKAELDPDIARVLINRGEAVDEPLGE